MRRFGVEIGEILKKHHPVINREHMIGSLKAEYNFRIEQMTKEYADSVALAAWERMTRPRIFCGIVVRGVVKFF